MKIVLDGNYGFGVLALPANSRELVLADMQSGIEIHAMMDEATALKIAAELTQPQVPVATSPSLVIPSPTMAVPRGRR